MPRESKKFKDDVFGVFSFGGGVFYGREIKKRKPGELRRIALFSSKFGRVPKRQVKAEALLESEVADEKFSVEENKKTKYINRKIK